MVVHGETKLVTFAEPYRREQLLVVLSALRVQDEVAEERT